MCAGPCLLKIKHQRSSTFTLLLISKSYWFDKSRFVNKGKLLLSTSTPSLGHNPTLPSPIIKQFSGAVAGDFGATARGVSYSQSLYFVFVLLVLFLVSLFFLLQNFKTQKKFSVVFIFVLLVCLVIYLLLMVNFFETRSFCGFTEDQQKYYKEHRLSQKE